MAGQFWLSDRQWAAIAPLLPTNQLGARRVPDRRVISGIVHMLRNGGRWQDCPACYGPSTTIYNRYHRWSGRGIWAGLLANLPPPAPCAADAASTRDRASSPSTSPQPSLSLPSSSDGRD